MHIRPAEHSDIAKLAAIAVASFSEEPIYTHFFPRRTLYPNDYQASFVRNYRTMLNTPGQVIMVAETDEEDFPSSEYEQISGTPSKPEVVGYATFVRSGSQAEIIRWNGDNIFKCLQRTLTKLESYFCPDRSVSSSTIASYYKQALAVYAMPEGSSYLEFKTLAVEPAYQRKGYGEKLVQWCGRRAIEEGIPVFGDASASGLPLYVRNGCKEIGRIVLPEQVVEQPPGFEGGPLTLERMEVVVLRWESDTS